MFNSGGLSNSYAAYDALDRPLDFDVATNGGRAAASLQSSQVGNLDLQTGMGASAINRWTALQRTRAAAEEIDRMRRSQQRRSGIGGILGGGLGLAGSIASAIPGGQLVGLGLSGLGRVASSF